MSVGRSTSYDEGLVRELVKLPVETEWVEFKDSNDHPQEIGVYISALANAAALAGKAHAYLVWGVRDQDHALVGTTVDPVAARKGNEELQSWLLRLLKPHIDFRFSTVAVDAKRLVLLEIAAAARSPVSFAGTEYIRVGSYKKPLKDFPEKERELWRHFDRVPFEDGVARGEVGDDEVLRLLDAPGYFDLLELPLPDGRAAILDAIGRDGLVRRCAADGWDVTNLGAILFEKRLEEFPGLGRKALRVVQYKGKGRTAPSREQSFDSGYAIGFRRIVEYLAGLLPVNEELKQALRHTVPVFPEVALRELVANALIHQDFGISGTGPMVEIFEDRLEITNPGEPLLEVERLLDSPPRSRNEALASLMRRARICEERGIGIDRVIQEVELFQLPPPLFEKPPGSMRVVLFGPRRFAAMTREERIRACYWHACLQYVKREPVTNTTVRARFGIDPRNAATASRVLKDALDAGALAVRDPAASRQAKSYVPWWAKREAASDPGR